MNIGYLFRLLLRAQQYAQKSKQAGDKRPVGTIKKEIVSVYRKYGIKASEYLSKGLGTLSDEERKEFLHKRSIQEENLKKYDENRRFLAKYSGLEWEKTRKKRRQRKNAYIKHYHMGKHCRVQYGVIFIAEHLHDGKLVIGDNVLFARDVDIDFTGDLVIGNGVSFAEGSKVLTHDHDFFGFYDDSELIPYATHRAHNTPLTVKDNVLIGARSIIMPGVTEIGENSIISAGSIVTKPVPANCVVSGNPAKIVSKIQVGSRVLQYHVD